MVGHAHYTFGDGLLAGPYPDTKAAVAGLEGAGVTVFVDLTHPSDPLDSYEPFLAGARRVAEPIPDMGTPTSGQVIRILDLLDETRANGGSAYVHCWGGVGRTGTVVGCWLMRHGLDRGDAVATIAVLRAGLPGARPSPETSAQVALIQGWRRGR
jgi:polymorphic toxin system DSP-PTPase phosphatase-like protein